MGMRTPSVILEIIKLFRKIQATMSGSPSQGRMLALPPAVLRALDAGVQRALPMMEEGLRLGQQRCVQSEVEHEAGGVASDQ
jgi:hypothetical protein